MHVNSFETIPIKIWAEGMEDSALAQARNLANLPFAFKHIAIMPDVHCGYGMPIGGVLATKGVVIPNAVGVDIGCGMYAAKTTLHENELNVEVIKRIMGGSKEYQGGIRSSIPTGFSHHSKKQAEGWMPDAGPVLSYLATPVVLNQFEKARNQVGTLGGGNHFIEIQADQEGFVWFMIHSGSRNLGFKVANHYNDLAKKLNKRWHANVPNTWDLAFLPLDTEEGQSYLAEMGYCVEFAKLSRCHMANNVRKAFSAVFPNMGLQVAYDVAHNYAHYENHFGENVMVHRKGATRARNREWGIIPGSQGTASYIVQGKGNPESFHSCSHGAGRLMSRTKAKANLVLEDEVKRLDDLGVVHGIRHVKDLDEAPGAYKDVTKVIEQQMDLIDVKVVLKPLAVIKG